MYGTTAGVSALVPSVGTLGSSSTPTQARVTTWLQQASASIDRKLGSAGYSVPVGLSTDLANELASLAELYAASYALMARGLDTVTGATETRSEIWMTEYRERLKDLLETDLTAVGGVRSITAKRRSRIRTLQIRRVDGYSGAYEGDAEEYDNTSE